MKLTTGYKKPIASSGTDAQEQTSNNSYLLLAGGGHKALSDFATAGHTHNNYLERLQQWNEADSHNVDNLSTGTTFAYTTHNAPTNGTIVAFSCLNGNYQLQLQGQYGGENLYFRNKNGDNGTWNTWRYVIHDGNISSQSVNYATSAGNAVTATNADTIDGEHADSFLKRLRRNNLDISSSYSGMVPPDILSFKNGYPVYTDPEFATGYNNISVYNYGGSGVTITRESSTTSGNSSGYCLHIKSSTSGYPNGGGWCFATDGVQARVSVCIFRANIPEGYNVKFYSNSTGDGSNVGWLTSTESTGKYEWYAYMVEWGSSPSNSFYFTLDKAADVDWYLSYANVIDISRASYDGLRTRYSDYATSAGNASTAAKLTTSAGSATLPIYFSDGVPVACTASSVFSDLSNSGNDLSVTVAGKNRTLTVAYAESAGNAGTLGGYHESAFSKNGHTHTTSEITNFPTIGNGALHLKVNGTELTPEGGIFTANKGDNSTINITVPTAESIEESTLNKLGDKVVLKNGFTTELAKEMAEVISEKNTKEKLIFKFANPATSLECNPDILSVNYIKVGEYYRLNISGSFELNGFNFYEQKLQDNYNPVLYSVSSGTINNVELSAKKTGMLYFRLSDQQVSQNGAYGPVVFELSVFVESISKDSYSDGIYGELNITQFYQ